MINISVKGLDELKQNLDKLSGELKTELSGIMERGAQTFVRNAKRDAPVNFGVLKGEITYEPLGNLTFSVMSGVKYSPYLEWGTITKVDVPGELAEYANQFKGKGLRKTGGIRPHPFFFKQQGVVQKQLETDIQSFLNEVQL